MRLQLAILQLVFFACLAIAATATSAKPEESSAWRHGGAMALILVPLPNQP